MFPTKLSGRAPLAAVSALALLALGGVALAQVQEQPPPAEPDPQAELRSTLAHLHAVNQIEVQIALLALNQSQTDAVREYSSRVAADHQRLDRELLSLANELDLEVAGGQEVLVQFQRVQVALQSEIEALVQAGDQEFDRAYLDLVITSHEMAVRELRQARERDLDARARAVVDRSVQVMQAHLSEARRLRAALPGEPVG